jgi:phosphoglycolate phosphatase-like HAD superfamily hydrolase
MQNVKLVITDLDDTLWDWLEMWHSSFQPYLKRISVETGIKQSDLIPAFKKLHQQFGTTEMSFAYKEIGLIDKTFHPLFENSTGDCKSILHEYYSNKKNNLKLYDGVLDTLIKIKSTGAKIVAFTESYVFFTKYRLKHLELDGIIDAIYSPQGSNLPSSVSKHYVEDYWEPKYTKMMSLPNDTRKPNPTILENIINDCNVIKQEVIYIGDKLDRDIYMAEQAEVTSVYAKYGHVTQTEKYKLLVNVTHWTDEDVLREEKFRNNLPHIKQPDFTINKFSELLTLFTYGINHKANGRRTQSLGKNH